MFLPLYLGVVPFPISAFIAGVVNLALVWAASHWTSSPRLVALPLWTWLFTVCVLLLGGPGGDIVFAGVGWRAVGPVLVLVLGAGPATWYLTRRRAAPS